MTTEPRPPSDTNAPLIGPDSNVPAPANPIQARRGWHKRYQAVAVLLATLAGCLMAALVVRSFYSRPTANDDPILLNRPQSGDERASEAVHFRTEAEEVRRLAFENWKIERDARRRQDQDRRIAAEQESRISRHLRYVSDMRLVEPAWEAGQTGAVLELLESHRPVRAPEGTSDDQRGFEWYYWNRKLHVARMRIGSAEIRARGAASESEDSPFTSESDKATRQLENRALTDAAPEQFRTLAGQGGPVLSVAFSPDGMRIITASRNNSVSVWGVAGKLLFTFSGKEAEARNFAVSQDGKQVAAAASDYSVKVLRAESGEELFTLSGHTGLVNGIAFSADGGRIASASDDRSVRIWDALAGNELLTLKGHTSAVLCVAFSPDQTCVAAGSDDGSIKIWHAPRE